MSLPTESLRPIISESLARFESAAGLTATFRALPRGYAHRANSVYDPINHQAIVSLADGWRDVDVAHEVEHLRLQLVDGFGLFAWRLAGEGAAGETGTVPGQPHDSAAGVERRGPRPVEQRADIDASCTRILTYTQDEVVHERLVELGLVFDGEVIDPALFHLYHEVARRLRDGARPAADGMAFLDAIGRGRLCRACYYVQATLIRDGHRNLIHIDRRKRLEAFLAEFAKRRKAETRYAEKVLAFFRSDDVGTPGGHDRILASWAALEDITAHTGVSHYERTSEGHYRLPWPGEGAAR